MKTAKLPEKLAFVDLETTGCSFGYDKVIEIGILRVENNILVKTYNSLVNPNRYVPPEIEKLTGINAKELENAPTFGQVKKDVQEILGDCIFVAHNARFDYGFLKKEFREEGLAFQARQLCTAKLSRRLYPQYRHHNLDSLILRHNLGCQNRHRAFDDAQVLKDFYDLVIKEFPETVILKILKQLLKQPSLPANIDPEMVKALPETPGVYLFYDKQGMPLYVGKSINIKDRVLSHFSADSDSTREQNIAKQIFSIEVRETAGELGALLKELSLIKQLLPVYNRKSRFAQRLIVLFTKTNSDGYKQVVISEATEISVQDLQNVAGIFKSKKQAKDYLLTIAQEYNLCDKLLGLEKTKAGCFGHRLDRCKGACLGKEKAVAYNLRLEEALFATKIRPWPFPGAVLIKETNQFTGLKEGFIFEQWSCLGYVKDLDDETKIETYDLRFDWEVYKILNRFLTQNKNQKNISLVTEVEMARFISL